MAEAAETHRWGVVGTSPQMQDVLRLVEAVAPTRAPVLLVGETGSGKGLLAKVLHERSGRTAGPLVVVNCAALSGERLHVEVFGDGDRAGAAARARGGTLFLDAVGDLPLATQEALAAALAPYGAKGGNLPRDEDVRLVAAMSEHPIAAASEGRFSPALLELLDGVRITIPPLRERAGDVLLLAGWFLDRAAEAHGRRPPSLSPEAQALLEGHRWDGNVRELENAMERAAVVTRGDMVSVHDLPSHLLTHLEKRRQDDEQDVYELPFSQAKERALELFERRYAESLLSRAKGNVSEAARRAGLDRSNFRRLMARYGVRPDDFRQP